MTEPRTAPEVSIVVIGWRDAPALLGCLGALAATPPTVSHEVVVTLNEPTPALLAALAAAPELYDALTHSPVNRGYAAANDAGAAVTTGRALLFLNDDARVAPGWLEPLVSRFEEDSTIGAVASVLVDEDGNLVEAGCYLYADGRQMVLVGDQTPAGVTAGPVLYASGAALLVRRGAFEAVGGFDPGYFPAYFEDADLAMKLAGQGLTTWLEPASQVVHHHDPSEDRHYARYLCDRNRERFLERWPVASSHFLDRPAELTPEHLAMAATRSREIATQLAGTRAQAVPAIPDEQLPSDAVLQGLEVTIFHDYVRSLTDLLAACEERIAELERREVVLQLLVAERDETLEGFAGLRSALAEREAALAATQAELDAYRHRKVIQVTDRASSLLGRRSGPAG